MGAGVYNYIEKYLRTPGNAEDGIYCYNFCLNTTDNNNQPTGAMNMNKFNKIEMEFNTIIPPYDEAAATYPICDNGNLIGINKPTWNIFKYNYDLTIHEERYNIIEFKSGM